MTKGFKKKTRSLIDDIDVRRRKSKYYFTTLSDGTIVKMLRRRYKRHHRQRFNAEVMLKEPEIPEVKVNWKLEGF